MEWLLCVKPIYYHNIIKNDQIKCTSTEMLANTCICELSVLDYCTILDHHELTSPLALSCSTVAFSTNPKHPSAIPTTEKKTKKGKGRAKEKAREEKKNPCLEEYKDFCIHGVCQHLKELNTHSCVWVSCSSFAFPVLFHKLRTCFYFRLNHNFQN